jgi:hypothetical protein
MMTALTLGLLVVVALLVGRIQKMAKDQRELWRRLNSISLMPGWIRLRDDTGEVNISAGSLGLRGPHGHASPGLNIHTVPGTVYKYPYTFHDGRESQEEACAAVGSTSSSPIRRSPIILFPHTSDLSSAMTP